MFVQIVLRIVCEILIFSESYGTSSFGEMRLRPIRIPDDDPQSIRDSTGLVLPSLAGRRTNIPWCLDTVLSVGKVISPLLRPTVHRGPTITTEERTDPSSQFKISITHMLLYQR